LLLFAQIIIIMEGATK